jgi:protocatechuate 3,4-dioxygenase beta subunit
MHGKRGYRSAWLGGVLLAFVLTGHVLARPGDEAPPSLVVTVTTDEGTPLEGARVVVWNEDDVWYQDADAEGVARFRRLPDGGVAVQAMAEKRVAEERYPVTIQRDAPTRVEMALDPGIPFDGQVRTADDAPVEDATVTVLRGGTYGGFTQMFPGGATPYGRASTDAEGRFHVGGIPPDAVATVAVAAPGLGEARVAVRAVGDAVRPSPLVIVLQRGGSIEGVVHLPDGSPAAGARVLAIPADQPMFRENPYLVMSGADGTWIRATVGTADEEGRYALRGLALDAAVVVAAEAEGFARSVWSEAITPTAEHPSTTLDLPLRRPAGLDVTVTRKADGAPVPDAEVRLGDTLGGQAPTDTPSAGRYVFRGLGAGDQRLRVEAKGFLPDVRTVTVPEGGTLAVTVVLDAGVAIRGVLLDEAGRPVEGAGVDAERIDPEPGEGWHSLTAARDTTDAQGRFVLGGLRPGRYRVAAVKRNLGTATIRFTVPEGDTLPTSAYVWRRDPDGGASGGGEKIVDGVMRFVGFEGTEILDIRVDGYVRVIRTVDGAPGKDVDLGPVVLDPGLTIAGRVVDAAGGPVAAAEVSYEGYTSATTDEDGRFSLPHLPKGTVALDIDAEGFLPRSVEAWAGPTLTGKPAEAVTAVVYRGAVITGTLRDDDGKALAGEWIDLERPSKEAPDAWENEDSFETDEDGRFEMRVAPGPCRLTVRPPGEDAPRVLARLSPEEGSSRRLDLVLENAK